MLSCSSCCQLYAYCTQCSRCHLLSRSNLMLNRLVNCVCVSVCVWVCVCVCVCTCLYYVIYRIYSFYTHAKGIYNCFSSRRINKIMYRYRYRYRYCYRFALHHFFATHIDIYFRDGISRVFFIFLINILRKKKLNTNKIGKLFYSKLNMQWLCV